MERYVTESLVQIGTRHRVLKYSGYVITPVHSKVLGSSPTATKMTRITILQLRIHKLITFKFEGKKQKCSLKLDQERGNSTRESESKFEPRQKKRQKIKSKTPWESDNRCTRPWPDKNGSDLWIPNLSFLSLNAENFAIKRV